VIWVTVIHAQRGYNNRAARDCPGLPGRHHAQRQGGKVMAYAGNTTATDAVVRHTSDDAISRRDDAGSSMEPRVIEWLAAARQHFNTNDFLYA
jgi:hypothetical protein